MNNIGLLSPKCKQKMLPCFYTESDAVVSGLNLTDSFMLKSGDSLKKRQPLKKFKQKTVNILNSKTFNNII